MDFRTLIKSGTVVDGSGALTRKFICPQPEMARSIAAE